MSSKTHTQKQPNNNPNDKAYKHKMANNKMTTKMSRRQEAKLFDELGLNASLDWMCYSKGPYEFD